MRRHPDLLRRYASMLFATACLVAGTVDAPAQFIRGGMGRGFPGQARPGLGGFGLGLGLGIPVLMDVPRAARPLPTEPVEAETEEVPHSRKRGAAARPPPHRVTPTDAVQPRPARPRTALRAVEERGVVPGEVLVELRPEAPPGAAARLARRYGLTLISTDRFTLVPLTVYRFRFAASRRVGAVATTLGRDPLVATARPNHVYTLAAEATGDQLAAAQYAVEKLRLTEAHRLDTGRGVTVALIDTEVDTGHPALAGLVDASFDALDAKPARAGDAHGTAIAGLVSAHLPLASAAPDAHLLAARAFSGAKVTGDAAQGTTLHVLRGLDWAAGRHARLVNMSFAGPADATLARFLQAGADRGILYVAAAGNAGPASPPLYPAADPNVLAVTATDADDRLYAGANRGRYIGVAAPGVEIMVAKPGGAFGFATGTSMAAAEVSGILAMLLQARPDATPAVLRDLVTRAAHDLGPAGVDDQFGAGLADAAGALDLAGRAPVAAAAPMGGTAPASRAP